MSRIAAGLLILLTAACAAPQFDLPTPRVTPEAPRWVRPPEARVSTSASDAAQKLQFDNARFFDEKDWIWKEQYFNLPPGWNAFQDDLTADTRWGIIRTATGKTFRWSEGMVGSTLHIPSSVVWKRSNENPAFEYGVVRQSSGQTVFVAGIGTLLFEAESSDDQMIELVVGFVRSLSPTAASCRGCVWPVVGVRK